MVPEPTPLVSCLMPTADRRRFIPWAIGYFQRQDYPNRELVIVDDGRDPVADLVPSDDTTIRYVRLDERLVTGAKRNRACREAAGDIIVHWDDDDWFAPWRIRYQVDELLRTGADLCGLNELFFLDLDREHGWRYQYPRQSKRPWVAGGTMAYRRSLWERRPFPEVRQGEDTRFLWQQNTAGIAVLDRSDFYVATIHGANTSRKQTATRRWTAVQAATILNLMGDDHHRYRSRRPVTANRGRAMAGPAPSSPAGSAGREPPTPAVAAVSPVAALSSSTSTVDHRVVVSIPHFGPARYLRAAVDSILAQTHRNLVVVVVFDGDPSGLEALSDITDRRLVRFELPVNRGRYFADQIVLEAVAAADPDCRFFVVQDSDDWSDPGRVEQLVQVALDENAEVCLSASLQHDQRQHRDRIARGRSRLDEPVTAELVHRVGHQGLYRVEALQRLGGWYAGYRIGFDTSIVNLLLMTGTKISYVDEPLYHRRIHSGSLTNSPAFGWGSPVRTEVVAQLRSLHRAAYRMATTAPDHRQAAEQIRALVEKRMVERR